jgi:hypothetical protein
MSPSAVSQRLRESSEQSDLTATRRLATKVDMSPQRAGFSASCWILFLT